MKLFVFAALIAVAAAARLEHLERSYLPPDHYHSRGGLGAGQPGLNAATINKYLPPDHYHSQGALGAGQPGLNAATINKYLPPDHGPSAAASDFAGSIQGFGALPQSNQYAAQPSFAPQGPSSFVQPSYQPQQLGAASRQYLAPNTDPTQNIPQQAFDEQTGYHY